MRIGSALCGVVCAILLGSCSVAPRSAGTDGGESWAIDAELVESCCCDAICPCIVGSPPTRGHCLGNRLVVIHRGHFGHVRLDGVKLILTFNIGEWTTIWVEESVTDAQVVALRELLDRQRNWLFGQVSGPERVPLTLERSATTIEFAVPAATTEVEVMTGLDGLPIEVHNLRSFRDYVQYKSKTLTHTSEEEGRSFQFSGTNGFHARYSASST